MSKFYFTMIVYVDNDALLKRAISSIMSVSDELSEKIKLIVTDAVCSDDSVRLCKSYEEKYGTENFQYIKAYGMNIGEAYNTAVPNIRGTYVNFSLASTWFSAGSTETVWRIAEKSGRPKLISLVPWTVNEKHESVQYRMSPKAEANSFSEEIRLYREPAKLQLMFHAYFIRTYLLNSNERHMWFRPELFDDAPTEMLCRLLAEFQKYLYLPKLKLNYTYQLEDNTSTFEHQYQEWWYLDSLKNWMLPFAREWNAKDYPIRTHMRILLLYLVFARFNCNYNDRNKGVLHGESLNAFLKLSGEVLQYVDHRLIFSRSTFQGFVIPRPMRILFLKLKAEAVGKVCEAVVHGNRLFLWTHRREAVTDNTISALHSEYAPGAEDLERGHNVLDRTEALFVVNGHSLAESNDDSAQNNIPVMKWAFEDDVLLPLCEINKEYAAIRAINYCKGKLEIDGVLSIGEFLDREQVKLTVRREESSIPVKFSEIYGLDKLFGVTYHHKYMFHVSIPVFSLTKRSKLQFVLDINGEDNVIEIRTQSIYSHVREDVRGQYWRFAEEWCLNIARKNEMYLTMVTQSEINKREADYQKELLTRAKSGDKMAAYAVELRQEYFARKNEFPDERIWITFDKLYKAGDNGEYLYDYISSKEDGIDIRYLIKNDAPDYERMREKGDKLLVWGEKETLVTALRAEAVLTTHANIASYVGFDKKLIPYICDLFSPVNVCIQHGLTVQDIAQFQNRLFDNLHLYLCVSPNEIANLSRPIYGFTEKGSVRLAGIARYDGLHSKEQRQILITPTWRRDIVNANIAHFKKEHNDSFKNSEYYRIYNQLINDKKLIECAKKYHYRIVYLLHPATSAQLDDYDRNDYVELIPAASDMSYEKILTESSLMITDYSGIQFDFAYMRKPVLYYHPAALPPHYDESKAYRYERDAFGPVLDNHEELVDAICDYMSNDCKMKDEYRERADRFFAYNDFNNCERIYNEILAYLNDERGERYGG